MLVFTMASCREDYDMPEAGSPINPEMEVAGEYQGTWTRVNDATGAVESFPGSVTLSAGERYVANISVSKTTTALGLAADESVVNVLKKSSDFAFYNLDKKNPFGIEFSGEIISGKDLSMKYTSVTRSGRKEVIFHYTFVGTKL